MGEDPPLSYWQVTRRPLPNLVFILPVLLFYELGVVFCSRPGSPPLRTGVDAWLHQGLMALGLPQPWVPGVVLVTGLVLWQIADPLPGRLRQRVQCVPGMAVESLIFAVVLVGLGRLVDEGLSVLEHSRAAPLLGSATQAEHPLAPLVGYVGAGLYEEAVFRLALVPLLYGGLRLLLTPSLLAGTLAVTGSALLFSIAHHAGPPGEAFTWYAFFYRWAAGIFFAWVFLARGYGVAVGTHSAYDILVSWFG